MPGSNNDEGDKWPSILFWSALHSIVSCCVVYQVNQVQPTAYMDEYFHEKQTLDYIAGHWFNWDPKITTPPGLYVLTSLISRFLLPLSGPSVRQFRYVNCALMGINYALVSSLIEADNTALLTSAIVTLPVLFFTSFLFYTDQLSLALVLLAIWSHRRKYKFLTFFAATGACCVRQTNIVWCAFIVGQAVATRLSFVKAFEKRHPLSWIGYIIMSPVVIIETIARACVYDCPSIVLIGIGFLVFVFYNNGVALGDRSAHEISLNIPQVFYFLAFAALQTPLRFFRFFLQLCCSIKRSRWSGFVVTLLISALLIAVGFASVHCCTVEHKYTLADNRHYTFYIWARFFKRYPWFRYAALPFYALSGAYVLSAFLTVDGRPCRLEALAQAVVFAICTAACLVPTPLLEFRYFIVPFVLWRIQMKRQMPRRRDHSLLVISEFVLNLVVNVVTIWMFLFKPFKWPSRPWENQRFMW